MAVDEDHTKQLLEGKEKFMKKHAISSYSSKLIDKGVKIQDRVTLPRKRSAESDLEEEAVGLKKQDKKRRKK